MSDYALESTFDVKFTSRAFATGIPTTLAGTPAIVIYEDNGTTEITAAETLSVDFDGITGLNNLRIVATAANGFELGKSYSAVLSAGTVGGVSVVGETVCNFTIGLIALNATAQAAIEDQYDGTGLSGGTYPATQDQANRNADLGESRRGFHTWQGNYYYVDPVNGDTHASGNRGGRADPYKTIQDCHDNAVTDSNHDVIFLVAGHASTETTHTVAATTTISKRYTFIRGPGRDFIVTRTGNGPTFAITGDGVEITGVQIGSPGAAATSSGVDIVDADFARIHKCWILDTQGDGISILRSSNCQIHDNHFDNTGIAASAQGIHVSGAGAGTSSDTRIEHNHISNTGGTAILIDDGTTNDTVIVNNQIHDAGGWAIDITASSTDAFIHNNHFGNNASGNIQDGGTTSIILNNYDIVDGVWDELLTGATHNIATSSGRRLRDITSPVTHTGTAVSATANTITLDAGANTEDGSYDPSQIITTAGTGEGQVRGILEYFGTGANGNPDKTAILDRDWKTTPDATTEFTIIAQDGRLSTNEGQLRAASSTVLKLNSLAPGVGEADLAGQTIQLLSGTGQDQVRLILSYNGTTQEATVDALEVTPDATTGYQILPFGTVTLDAIQNDMQSATDLKDLVDTGYDPVTHSIVLVQTVLVSASSPNCNVTSMSANTITDTALATSAVTEIQSGLATEAKQDIIDTNLDSLIATVGVAGAGLTDLGGMSTGMKAEVNAEADTALADYDGPTNAEMVAAFTEIKGATWTTTDTLEAIRDRGDDAWTTATSVTVSDKTGFSLAADGLDSVVVETDLNARQALSIAVASAAGKLSGAATTTVVILGAGVATTRITATVDADGNRSAVTLAAPA